MQSIIQQALPFYKLEDLDLKEGETEIDEGLVGLIITQPGKDFTDKELRRIDQFVMRGRSLVVVAGAANLKASDSTMKGGPVGAAEGGRRSAVPDAGPIRAPLRAFAPG